MCITYMQTNMVGGKKLSGASKLHFVKESTVSRERGPCGSA